MPTWQFQITIEDIDVDDDVLDALDEAGCGDALFGSIDGVAEATFARSAPSFGQALGSAVAAIESAVPGTSVVRADRNEAPAAPA